LEFGRRFEGLTPEPRATEQDWAGVEKVPKLPKAVDVLGDPVQVDLFGDPLSPGSSKR